MKHFFEYCDDGDLEPLKISDFMELYTVNMPEKTTGLLIIDKSDGHYPLVIYSWPKKSNRSRMEAWGNVLEDLQKNAIFIVDEFEKHTEWTEGLQQTLQQKFNYP